MPRTSESERSNYNTSKYRRCTCMQEADEHSQVLWTPLTGNKRGYKKGKKQICDPQ
jgi:hypothetical protein